MSAQLLEKKYNQQVVRKFGLGGTKVAFDALKYKSIDLYPEYTGTGYTMLLKQSGQTDERAVFNIVRQQFNQKYKMTWADSLGFNNTYALAVRKSDESLKDVHTISDLAARSKDLTYAAPYEFMERKDGHKLFASAYGFKFVKDRIKSMGAGLLYPAIRDNEVDTIVVYSTDGRVKAHNLRILKDDRNFFPPYTASLLVNNETLEQHPILKNVFKDMKGLINEQEMMSLNDQVDGQGLNIANVVQNFLVSKKALSGDSVSVDKGTGFASFVLANKDFLMKALYEHLLLCACALILAMIVALPLGVVLTRYSKLGSFVFPIINTVQTIPSLALLGFLIPFMGIGFLPACTALFLYSLLPLVRNTYSGIMGVDKNYIEASKGVGLTNWQILCHVEFPLAMPVILTGIRTAVVIVIATATLAALIGAGGLGDPIFRGLSTVNENLILLGAVPAALLAVICDKLIGLSERFLISKGIRLKNAGR
jgi:osmoprotectant transport system permease protein